MTFLGKIDLGGLPRVRIRILDASRNGFNQLSSFGTNNITPPGP